jgi:hypothetical protein
MNAMQQTANDWTLIGLVLAVVLLFAIGIAFWTRLVADSKIQGQTFWHVAVGVGGVVVISGFKIGFEAAGFVLICFTLAAIPMAWEYFDRVRREEREAQKVREEAVDVNAGADRKE